MKTLSEIIVAIAEGRTIVVAFRAGIEDKETYAERNMRARITWFNREPRDEVMTLTFSFEEFSEFNKAFESSNYFDKSGKPTLNARQAGLYTAEEVLYFDTDEPIENLFKVLPDTSLQLFSEFQAASGTQSYVCWLESLVLGARA
jgi:hypothetical protein